MILNNITEEYEKEFGFSPIRLMNMSYEQKYLLLDELQKLNIEGLVSTERYNEIVKEYSKLLFKHFPETIQYLRQDESQSDEN